MIDWHGFERNELQEELIDLSKKEKYGEEITDEEKALLSLFDCLNIRKTTEENIDNFFEVLDEVIYFLNKRGEVAENCDD